MSREGLLVAAWGLLLTVLFSLMYAFGPDELPPALLAGAAVFAMACGAFLALIGRRRAPEPRHVSDLSLATALAGVALGLLVAGMAVGLWLVYIGAGLLALALGGLVREERARRRGNGRRP